MVSETCSRSTLLSGTAGLQTRKGCTTPRARSPMRCAGCTLKISSGCKKRKRREQESQRKRRRTDAGMASLKDRIDALQRLLKVQTDGIHLLIRIFIKTCFPLTEARTSATDLRHKIRGASLQNYSQNTALPLLFM